MEWVRKCTKVKDIITTVKEMKWRWAGHVNKMKDNRWKSKITT